MKTTDDVGADYLHAQAFSAIRHTDSAHTPYGGKGAGIANSPLASRKMQTTDDATFVTTTAPSSSHDHSAELLMATKLKD